MRIGKLVTSAAIFLSAGVVATTARAEKKIGPDDSWVTLSGTVVAVDATTFRLDYGPGIVTVEMDDFDSFSETNHLFVNDYVVVNGMVDDDLFEKKTIEASSVYVPSIGTSFYASSLDEEDYGALSSWHPVGTGYFDVSGTVTSVDGREFTVSAGLRSVKVDTDELGYNPMDDAGFQKVRVGDRVRVLGKMDYDLFERREIKAKSVVILRK